MESKFQDIPVGSKFVVNNIEYVKTEEVRVSCCRSINCQTASDPGQKTYFPSDAVVTING